MTRTKFLALAMYLGAAVAGAAVALAADRMTDHNGSARDSRSRRERFFDQLRLSAAQRDSANVILDERDRRSQALREQNKAVLDPIMAAQDSIFAESGRRMTALLTPEQKATYDQMRQAQQAQRDREKAARGEKKR